MPVENVYALGSVMYNKLDPHSALSESKFSFLGDVLEDEEFTEDTLKLIKDKDKSIRPYWRYLTDSQAKAKKTEREELEAIAAGLEDDAFPKPEPEPLETPDNAKTPHPVSKPAVKDKE